MNKIFKKSILVLIVGLLVNGFVFAEAASTKLTDSDIKNFCKNFESLEATLEKYQLNMEDFGANLSKKQKTEVEAILNKNGISGPNAIGKVSMIGKCYMLHSMEAVFLLDPEMAEYMKMAGIDLFADSKKVVNSADYAVVLRNISILDEIFAVENDGTTYPSYDDEDYEEDEDNEYMKSNWEANAELTKKSKNMLDLIAKASKDSGRIYKYLNTNENYEKVKDSDYYMISSCIIYEEDYSNTISVSIDMKKKTLTFQGRVYEQSFEDFMKNGSSFTTKKMVYHITSVEGYAKEEGFSPDEYVIRTKEGAVFSFFNGYDSRTDAYYQLFNFDGLKSPLEVTIY